MRAAAYAADQGRGGPFVLAASRLAYCGGFELDDPEVLAEAAAAAGIALDDCLKAARDPVRDGVMEATSRLLLARGCTTLPAVRVGGRLVCGEHRLAEAAAYLRARGVRMPGRASVS
jgi:2-hydroxychromene-2-carboxylate isomerase